MALPFHKTILKWYWAIPFTFSLSYFGYVTYTQMTSYETTAAMVSIRVSQDNDDAEERLDDNSVYLTSSDLELGEDGSRDQICAMRFQNIPLPKGAQINSAYIEFFPDRDHTDALSVDIYGEDTTSATTFADIDRNISDRAKTSALIHWDDIENWDDNGSNTYNSPDISAIIQEIINRPDWVSNNDMAIMVEIDGTTGTRRAESYDGNSSLAPLLVIDYEIGTETTYIYDNTTSDTLTDQTDCNNTLTRTLSIPDSFFVEDLRVGLNLEHTYRGDLQVQLMSPTGTTVTLINQVNDGNDDFDLMLDDASANAIDDNTNNDTASPVYHNDRSAAPDNPLSAFDGEQAFGDWTLTFCNVDQGSSGGQTLTYNSARLMFQGSISKTCLLTELETTATCNNNATTTILTDDYYTITVEPEGIKIGSAYNVSGSYNGIPFSENNLMYGSPQILSVQIPIGANADLTITDVDSISCSISTSIISPPECSSIFTCWAISDEGNPDVLFQYDSEVNKWTEIGSTGINGIEALASNPYSEKVYTADNDVVGTLNLTGGGFSALGVAIGSLDGANGPHDIADIDGMSFDPFTGILWATERIADGTNNDLLFQIDTTDGDFIPDAFGTDIDYVVIPQVFDPINGQFVYDADDIAMDPETGDLYAVLNQGGTGGVLTILNKTDGSVKEVVGNFGDVDDIEALGFYNNGYMYGSTGNNSPDTADLNRFYSINKLDASLVERARVDSTDVQKDFEACDCLTGKVNTISGLIFHDENGNRVVNGGEIGLGGVKVNLYRDVDADSMFTQGVDVLLDTAATMADGTYSFIVASTGNFFINIDTTDLPTDTKLTTDNKEAVKFIGTGETNIDNNFGYIFLDFDYGDLPDTGSGTTGVDNYETLNANNGPRHILTTGLYLGAGVDEDADGIPDTNALGDDNTNDDEDGLNFLTSINVERGGTIRIPLTAVNTVGDTAFISAWIDWNGNGDFEELGENVANIKDNAGGSFPSFLEITISDNALLNTALGFRVRLSNSANMTSIGTINSGEVEDYQIMVKCSSGICLVINNVRINGMK